MQVAPFYPIQRRIQSIVYKMHMIENKKPPSFPRVYSQSINHHHFNTISPPKQQHSTRQPATQQLMQRPGYHTSSPKLSHEFIASPNPNTVTEAPQVRAQNTHGLPKQLRDLIRQEAHKEGVSAKLIEAIVKIESNGSSQAVSPKGAIGLMQLMPQTAKELNVNPYDPKENLAGGIRYIKQMTRHFGDLDLALAAYNAGPGTVKRYQGVPPYPETQNYIKKIREALR